MNEQKMLTLKTKEMILKYYRHRKKFPEIDWLCKKLSVSRNKMVYILRQLENEGFVKRSYANYSIQEETKEEKAEDNKIKKNKSDWQLVFIRIIMGLIGISASIVSIYYTNLFVQEFLPKYLALMFSAFMVLFSVFIFDALIVFWENKNKYLVIGCIFIWCIVLFLSMFSTVAGQYNNRISEKIQQSDDIIDIEKTQIVFDTLTEQEGELLGLLKQKETDMTSSQKLLKEFEDLEKREENWQIYWNTIAQRNLADKEIKKLRGELQEVRNKKLDFLSNTDTAFTNEIEVKRVDFYIWLSALFPLNPDLIQFWIYTFYAVFIDVIAPLAIAICMFLKRKGKNGA